MSDKYRELRNALSDATQGEWLWHTSCSWRRLVATKDGHDESVITPFVARDGQPDCNVSAGNMHYIEKAQPVVAAELLRERDALLEALENMVLEFNEGTVRGMVHDEREALHKARRAIESAKRQEG